MQLKSRVLFVPLSKCTPLSPLLLALGLKTLGSILPDHEVLETQDLTGMRICVRPKEVAREAGAQSALDPSPGLRRQGDARPCKEARKVHRMVAS